MTLEVRYDQTGRSGVGSTMVTEETSEVNFTDQGMLRFRAAPSGEVRRIDPKDVYSVSEAETGGFGMSL